MADQIPFKAWKEKKDQASAPRCTMCNKTNPFACGICASGAYCSKECQKADWPLHKILCEGYKRVRTVLRPDASHVIGLLFPVDSDTPRLTFIPTTMESHQVHDDARTVTLHLQKRKHVETLLGGPVDEAAFMSYNTTRHFPLTHDLHFTRLADRLNHPINQCARQFLGAAAPHLADFWYGPIVVTREQHYECDGAGIAEVETRSVRVRAAVHDVQDVMLADLRHAVEGLRAAPQISMERWAGGREVDAAWVMGLLALLGCMRAG